MAGRSPARLLAPLALVAFALALFVVISSATKDETEAPGGRDAGQAQSTDRPKKQGGGKKKKAKKTYVVKAGDTPSGIAEKANVELEQLLKLNPDLDPQTLTPGTTIKLR
jgi:LysM repeat protein